MSFTAGGTPRWMNPELLDPERFGASDDRPTKKSDCYALGMVVYEVRRSRSSSPRAYDLSGAFGKLTLLGDHKRRAFDIYHYGGLQTEETRRSGEPRVHE